MRPEDILELVRKRPFGPFRIYLTDGRTFEIFHPDQVLVLRSRITLGVGADPTTGIPDHAEHVSLLHIMRIEELPAASPSGVG